MKMAKSKKSKAKSKNPLDEIRVRKWRIERAKAIYPIGYELCQKDANRPATPDTDPAILDTQGFGVQLKNFAHHLSNLQFSEETEISVDEAKELIQAFKKHEPSFCCYNKVMQSSQEGRLVRTPEPQEMMRGDEWQEMSDKWRKELNDCIKSQEFLDIKNKKNAKPRRKRRGNKKRTNLLLWG